MGLPLTLVVTDTDMTQNPQWLASCIGYNRRPSVPAACGFDIDLTHGYTVGIHARDHYVYGWLYEIRPYFLKLVLVVSNWHPEQSRQRIQQSGLTTPRPSSQNCYLCRCLSQCLLQLVHTLVERSSFARIRRFCNCTDSPRTVLGTAIIMVDQSTLAG